METQFIKLNMTPTGVNPCFHVSQYDIGRSLGFIVYNGSEVVDLDSYACTIEATRSDGVAITASVTTDDNIGTFETTAAMTNKANKYKAQFVIVDENSKRIASLPFDMDVVKAAMDENAESIEEDASLYQQYTEAVQGAIAEANADIQAEENARIAAVNAEATARQNADAALQNNIDAEATARANAIIAEATARQSADNALQGNINSEASTRASADSNLQSQINQIIAPTGEAPSAAEVQNARIGADGWTYDTLGNAIRGQVSDLKNTKASLPERVIPVEVSIQSGWVNRTNLEIYSGNDVSYVSIPVTPREVYYISGWSQSTTYPCAFGVASGGTSAVIPLLLNGYSVSYVDEPVIIPDGVTTLYVNGIPSTNPISIKKLSHMSQEEFESYLNPTYESGVKAKYDGTNLLIKRKYNSLYDIVIRMRHNGGNSLFSFDQTYLVNDSDVSSLNDEFEPSASAPTTWSMAQSDWLGPYRVRAVNNADGDHPDSVYFTGGNHRSNNTASGGGVTAVETAFEVKFDGLTPVSEAVYHPNVIDVQWTNAIQAYNTSKDDGTGRAVLTETWNLRIEHGDTFKLRNDIHTLEDVVISRYYGLQAYTPNWNCTFVGGASRTTEVSSVSRNSGNKTCRSIIAANDYFRVQMTIDDTDLGLFDYSDFGLSTYGNKLYGSLIEGHELAANANEHYFHAGSYRFR